MYGFHLLAITSVTQLIKSCVSNIGEGSYKEKMSLDFHYPHEVWKMLDFERGERGELTFS